MIPQWQKHGTMTELRQSNRAKIIGRNEAAIKARMEGKFEWECRQAESPLCRVRANTRSEAWSKLAALGLNRRLGKFELLKVETGK